MVELLLLLKKKSYCLDWLLEAIESCYSAPRQLVLDLHPLVGDSLNRVRKS
jgi:hypothetical protein